eukprot:evm.model.scf_39.14 EVM.evm.TU.scf_39.14   scf_39:141981-144356(+)
MAGFHNDFSDDENLGLGAVRGTDGGPPDFLPLQPAQNSSSHASAPSQQEAQRNPKVEQPGPSGTGPPGPPSSGDGSSGPRPGSAVYIANLQWWTTDADVEKLCSAFGQVVSTKFLEERSNGKSKGVALVEFADPQVAMMCKEGLSGRNINGRDCVVTFPSQGSNRPSFGGRGMDRMGRGMDGSGPGPGRPGFGGRGGRGRFMGNGPYDRPGPGGMGMGMGMGMPDMGMPGIVPEMGMPDFPMDMMGPLPMDMGPHGGMMGGPPMHGPPPYPGPGRFRDWDMGMD